MEHLSAAMREIRTGKRRREDEGRDATHDKLLAQIPDHLATEILHALHWIAFSVRSLRTAELAEIL